MEQYIDIRYINNLINLGFSDINSYPNLKLKENHGNLFIGKDSKASFTNKTSKNVEMGSTKEIAKIRQLENIRNKVFILLDNFIVQNEDNSNKIIYKNSSILSYDIKTETIISKIFEQKKFDDYMKILVIEDVIYSIIGSKLLCFDHRNLEIIREWDIGEKFYNFCIYETSQILKMNLDIFYVNFQNELKFFGKCILFDIKQKTLYKEQNIIDKVIFHEDLLMWSSNFTIKIFDLKNKQMILRKSYDEVREDIMENHINDFESIINNDLFFYSIGNYFILFIKLKLTKIIILRTI